MAVILRLYGQVKMRIRSARPITEPLFVVDASIVLTVPLLPNSSPRVMAHGRRYRIVNRVTRLTFRVGAATLAAT